MDRKQYGKELIVGFELENRKEIESVPYFNAFGIGSSGWIYINTVDLAKFAIWQLNLYLVKIIREFCLKTPFANAQNSIYR